MNQRRRRVVAFILDMLIVSFLSISLSGLSYLNPYKDQYEKASTSYQEVYNEYQSIITSSSGFEGPDDMVEYINSFLVPSLSKLEKYSLFTNLWYIGLYFLYFVVFVYFNNGQTVGKKLFKLQVVDKTGDPASFSKLCVRSLINGSNLYCGVNFIVVIRILLSLANSSQVFFFSTIILGLINYVFEIAMVICLYVKKGEILLNDMVAGTKVISTK